MTRALVLASAISFAVVLVSPAERLTALPVLGET